ncbi:ATP-dependent endonuclease [Mycolicibacterium fluoranthenivorans]|uniref:ATP-dependent endonuclease n=1 Tax=Mycolicibacterium fluoranthenivorans TaxID=258505 RepID=A0A7G8PAI7_9MYCO|nr:ATP-dependent endonuclease [Mycolicibacterium fluoranthenivorans]QNJ91353.1 ATP-dependent endonuclease [Mycolicibacterium fluoranthenivorans]
MHIRSFRIQNFRRLKNVRVDLEQDQTIFVGANNSGKTSATHVFQLFLSDQLRGAFQIYDFSADCWSEFNSFDIDKGDADQELPQIIFDLWLHVDDENLHRVIDLIPTLEWDSDRVGVRLRYAPRSGSELIERFKEARDKIAGAATEDSSSYKPWPQSMVEYLTKQLNREYEIKYEILDPSRCDDELVPYQGYEPFNFGTQQSPAAKILDSIVHIDILNAQRHLSDDESRGRSEELSKRLSRFYTRNLEKLDDDLGALEAISNSENRLNNHFAEVFKPTIESLGEVGYPGLGNPGLLIKATLSAHSILNGSARVHYTLPKGSTGETFPLDLTLPDQYNGLGLKNLIYMVIEILDFHQAWANSDDSRAPIHLVIIEEPEVHLHAQLQQVFIRKILDVLPDDEPAFGTQLIITTHSTHIIYESNFAPIRYFCRATLDDGPPLSDVKNLSIFYEGETEPTRRFLQQYMKLTHCDLFFADAAVLVEGNVERLLLPLIIDREVPGLRPCHLTILEVGGAFAHKFENLLNFIGLPTLVITDLDSVLQPPPTEDSSGKKVTPRPKACMADASGAKTSNETLKQWLPKMTSISELLAADDGAKLSSDGKVGPVRVAYQTPQNVVWQEISTLRTARTLEEAFALANLTWTQQDSNAHLGLQIDDSSTLDIDTLHEEIYKRVRSLDKTNFALGVIACPDEKWVSPTYIVDGLQWLQGQIVPESSVEEVLTVEISPAVAGKS